MHLSSVSLLMSLPHSLGHNLNKKVEFSCAQLYHNGCFRETYKNKKQKQTSILNFKSNAEKCQ